MSDALSEDRPKQHLVVVSGPSGAGRTTAIHVLEDLGFEAIDNLPISLLRRLVKGPDGGRPMAVGIDVRTRDFSVDRLQEMLDWLEQLPWLEPQLLFVDCSEDVLVRRFSETRRRHPLSPASSAIIGIREELALLGPIRARADVLIDTADTTPHDLKAALVEWFGTDGAGQMGVTVSSFSYKKGIPKGVDMVFDCRFLRNPHWDPDLRSRSGLDRAVVDYVARDPLYPTFIARLEDMFLDLLPAFQVEGKSHVSLAFGCTGGQHRSVAVAETLANSLAEAGWRVSKRHREQDRWGGSATKRGQQA